MHTIHVEKELKAPLDRVWALVSDFSNLHWYPAAEKVEKVGSGVGEIRRITMPGMPAAVEERLLEIDEDGHRYVYEVLENEINIMRDYTVVATLRSTGPGTTLATWHGTFSGVNADLEPEMMVGMMQETYDGMLGELERAAKG